jgi:hypothetical protein
MTHHGAGLHLDLDSKLGRGVRKLLWPEEFELAGQGVDLRSAKLWLKRDPGQVVSIWQK